MKAAIEHQKREVSRLLFFEVKRAATDETDLERRNGLSRKQRDEMCHLVTSWLSSCLVDQNWVVTRVSQGGETSTRKASRLLSNPVRIATPVMKSRPPSISLPLWPACRRRSLQRNMNSLETAPRTSSGKAAPTPKTAITLATCQRSRLCAARTEAAPSVGPTQGLQTAPSNRPTANCPFKPVAAKPP